MLAAQNLDKSYWKGGREIQVLKSASFEINPGEIFGITGRSGAGKTTLCYLLSGLLQPDNGKVLYRGRDLSLFTPKESAVFRQTEIGIVFQQFNLLAELTLEENLRLPMLYARKAKAEIPSRVKELLQLFGLENRKEHFPWELSGGETQRAALARALVNSPRLVFCDEPTAELDEENAAFFYQKVQELNRDLGITWVIISHDPLASGIFHSRFTPRAQ